jgi:hypothetical protein
VEAGKRRNRLLMVVGALVVVTMAACGGRPTAQPQRGITISDLQHKQYFYQGDYLGRTITISARVDDVLAPRVFELSDDHYPGEKLLVVTDQPVEVSKDEAIWVTGTVGQLHRSAPSERVPYVQQDLYARHETDSYLYHATIESVPATSRPASGSSSVTRR